MASGVLVVLGVIGWRVSGLGLQAWILFMVEGPSWLQHSF